MCMRFGMGGYQELTQKEVADKMGISQSYISRLEKKIIKRLTCAELPYKETIIDNAKKQTKILLKCNEQL